MGYCFCGVVRAGQTAGTNPYALFDASNEPIDAIIRMSLNPDKDAKVCGRAEHDVCKRRGLMQGAIVCESVPQIVTLELKYIQRFVEPSASKP